METNDSWGGFSWGGVAWGNAFIHKYETNVLIDIQLSGETKRLSQNETVIEE